jgi:demethylmenaquinone methyltransferase/2-methoxy-6-polyprenyl-1,4-benzoquinol methylase
MFDGIAKHYDLLNRMISLGIDQAWRRRTVRALELGDGARVLDLATGTADLALLIAKTHPTSHVVGVDPSVNMMEVGHRKIAAAGLVDRVELAEGNAEQLEFADGTFDGVTIAFGIRNVPDRARGLREMARVSRPGGKVAILELSEPRSGITGAAARFHMHRVVPWLGGVISGSREYRYLPQSIATFPAPDSFAQMMTDAGLVRVQVHPLTFGVCHLYVGEAP